MWHLWYYIGAEKNSEENPGVAKFGIALEWGSRGPEFESQHSDQLPPKNVSFSVVFVFSAFPAIPVGSTGMAFRQE